MKTAMTVCNSSLTNRFAKFSLCPDILRTNSSQRNVFLCRNSLLSCGQTNQFSSSCDRVRVSIQGQSLNRPTTPVRWLSFRKVSSKATSPGSSTPFIKQALVEESLIPTATVKTFLTKNKYSLKEGFVCFQIDCPFCQYLDGRPIKEDQKLDSSVFFINKVSGFCLCECGQVKGSWHTTKDSLLVANKKTTKKIKTIMDSFFEENRKKQDSVIPEDVLLADTLWDQAKIISDLPPKDLEKLQVKFDIPEISAKSLDHFNVRYNQERSSLVFPHYGFQHQLTGFNMLVSRLRATPEDGTTLKEEDKPKRAYVRLKESLPRGIPLGLFGYNSFSQKSQTVPEIILASSELDALAIHEATQRPVLALPNSVDHLPQEVLPLLEKCEKVTIWFNNDMRSWEAAKHFSKKLNHSRCFLIRPLKSQPGPFEALRRGFNLKKILKQATPISHKSIVTFPSLREEVLSELTHAEQVAGVKWKRYPVLNKLLKGHRKGELTIFTGPTGSGKTTFMAEYSLDLCIQKVSTLWGSFEIQNVRLAKVMLKQFAQVNLEKNIDKFDKYANKFEELPLFFMAFHGSQTLDRVIEAMSHAVYVHDIEHVIIDNLQFMVGLGSKQAYSDRFAMYDNTIAEFRKFATENNCHVTVVVHPRKEKETEELFTSSIFGSAKASQEADNVLILQDRRLIDPVRGKKYIQVAKNRFDGDLGMMQLHFNKETLMMSPPTQKQKKKKKEEREGGISPANIEREGGDKYQIFEKLMLQSKSEDELGVGE